jgi:hypothetical protein
LATINLLQALLMLLVVVGARDSLDKPVVGGMAALETRYKSKWRDHFSASEKKTFHGPRW